MKRLLATLVCSFFAIICQGQFQSNSIGVAYLTKDTGDAYQFTIILPYETLDEDYQKMERDLWNKKIYFNGTLRFFDKSGTLLTLDGSFHFTYTFWCYNDGGEQFRPTLKTTVNKDRFKSEIKPIKTLQNLLCFVVVNRSDKKPETPDYTVSKQIKLEGDYDNDGKVDCFLGTERDPAENCSEDPIHHMALYLQIGKERHHLRCCGP